MNGMSEAPAPTSSHSHHHPHDHGVLDPADYAGLLHEMNHRLANLGRSLTADQWRANSFCKGWRVCDVFGHMTYGGITPIYKAIPAVLFRYAGNLTKGSKYESIRLADSLDQQALMARFDDGCDRPVGFGKMIKDRDLVLDHVIHELDIRRPLGIEAPMDAALLVGALAALNGAKSKLFAPAKAVRGLRLVATNLEWHEGAPDAPTVEGPAEDLLLAAGGRREGLAVLSGTGVDELARRTLRG
jgi:uncharacterized protein (TIGR03083 family)